MKKITYLVALLSVLTSCDKQINGRIKNNFNQPLENVSIKIKDSGFQTKSNQAGSYNLDYAAGEFSVEYVKENYLKASKTLVINEQQDYPMGDLIMTKIPDSSSLYFKGLNDYIKIPKIQLNNTKEVK